MHEGRSEFIVLRRRDVKKSKKIADLLEQLRKQTGSKVVLVEGDSDARLIRSMSSRHKSEEGEERIVVTYSRNLTRAATEKVIEKELRHILMDDDDPIVTTNFDRLIAGLFSAKEKKVELTVSGVIVPERKVAEGILVKSASLIWATRVDQIKDDWTQAFDIPAHVWEEIIAGAYAKAGFDEVILTPRSGRPRTRRDRYQEGHWQHTNYRFREGLRTGSAREL